MDQPSLYELRRTSWDFLEGDLGVPCLGICYLEEGSSCWSLAGFSFSRVNSLE